MTCAQGLKAAVKFHHTTGCSKRIWAYAGDYCWSCEIPYGFRYHICGCGFNSIQMGMSLVGGVADGMFNFPFSVKPGN